MVAASLMSSIFMSTISYVLLAIASGVPVQVTGTDGEQTRGSLAGVTDSGIVVDQDGTTKALPFDSVVSLEATSPTQATPPTMRISLHGGSELAAQFVSLVDDSLKIELRRQDEIIVPVKRVRAIRLRAGSPATDPQWLGIFESQSSGDVLVIRRDADRLDQVSGLVESIAENVVNFNVDGNQIQAPFDRLEGVVFGTSSQQTELASVQLNDTYGSRWLVESFLPSEGSAPIRIKFESGIEHAIPLEQINSIRWNSSLVMLATEQPAATSFQPVIGSDALEPAMKKWFGPNADEEDDVLMYGNSTIEYRIEPGFERVSGSFRHDDEVSRTGKVTVSITLDDKSVWTQALHPNEPSGFDIPIGDHRRVMFRVEAADDGDLGDTIRLSRPRLLK